ncbi:MAG: hypothetical protein NC302_11100 [Bacteroidales bacterium]|nr:hypothetical protein [Bacteroidales bacterium]MCM1416210.1 hypothetical protein [bacterium]MCM1424222.1 hypothetical protein [bacterium]
MYHGVKRAVIVLTALAVLAAAAVRAGDVGGFNEGTYPERTQYVRRLYGSGLRKRKKRSIYKIQEREFMAGMSLF